ncbi:hypothetical protein [Sphingomonas aracearum]|uniref:Lipoprotein n=1 Tax=Sphingomonas aracearum TaxID=2283317 RepID=A0A369VT82_9SPHN|nr:hypothetical protein [Sphingomonas aracearum]RDE05243.1 hypothetical protein DVW87_08195 [Sphingomonas aracearum]
MQLIRGCLMMLGLVALLFVTSCVVGVSGCNRMVNPREFGQTVREDPDKTRRMVSDFLESATYEDTDVAGRTLAAKVQDYTDGSVHLTGDANGERLIEITVTFQPARDGKATRVDVVSDAGPLAAALDDGSTAPELHRAIRYQLDGALAAIDEHRVLPRGMTIRRLIAEAKGSKRR